MEIENEATSTAQDSFGLGNDSGTQGDRGDIFQESGSGVTDAAKILEGAAGGEPAEGASGAWRPSFKFKVKDKELEFDDFVKPIIKTRDVEQKLKDIYEKAHGLDEVKASRETFKSQAEEWKNKVGQVESSLQTLGTYVKKGDFRSFFETLNIPKEKIIQFAIDELKYQELPTEQRQQIETQRQQQAEFELAQSYNQTLQTQMGQMVQRQAEMELSQELSRADIAGNIQAYDARLGQAGAFKSEVIKRGQYYEAVHKISPPANQLVAEVLNIIGMQAQQGMQQSAPGQVLQNQQAKPVISSFVGGGAKSPARKAPTSIDDLRKMRQNLTT